MNQADLGVALMLFVIFLSFTLYCLFGGLRREKMKAARYPLFEVRDQLVMLVAQGRVSEDDPTFQFLYQNVSHLIPHVKPLTLAAIVEALNTSTLRLENHSAQEEELATILKADSELLKVSEQFFHALLSILFSRSWFIWFSAGWTHSSFTLASTCRRFLSRTFQKQADAYRWYKSLNRITVLLAAA